MIDVDKWQEILQTLEQHKLRTALTAFGVFWGIFMLVILLGAGKGLENGVLDGFGSYKNAVFMWSAGPTQIPYKGLNEGRRINITPNDLDVIRNTVPELRYLSAVNNLWSGTETITRGSKTGPFRARGLEPDSLHISDFRITRGRYINEFDQNERRKVAVIGTAVRNILFDADEDPIGEVIHIGGIPFTVVGAYEAASEDRQRWESDRIIIPNATLRYTFNQINWIHWLQMRPKDNINAAVLEEKVLNLLKERHKVHPDDRGVFYSNNTQERYDKFVALFSGVKIFSWIVALGTIFAGVIGVGNIMLIVVKERTREIGIRKALGATSWSLIIMIVQEALVLTFISGYLGLVVGVALLEKISSVMMSDAGSAFNNPEISLSTAFIAISVLVVAGILAALLPASKAASVDPIIALQDE